MKANTCSSLLLLIAICAANSLAPAGSLTPPGAPAPTMKSLSDVEPRTAIHQSDMPLTITVPGSYYLTENLSIVATNTDAITVQTSNVSIDLRGFTIIGPGKTTGTNGFGIVESGTQSNVRVMNGAIRDFRGAAIALSTSTEVMIDKVTAKSIGQRGFFAGNHCMITNCIVESCGAGSTTTPALPITTGSRCIVSGNNVVNNAAGTGSAAANGILTGDESEISNNCVTTLAGGGTGGSAVAIQGGGFIRDNTIGSISTSGTGTPTAISVSFQGTVVSGNRISGCTANGSGAVVGIAGSTRSRITGNYIQGLQASTGTSLIGISASNESEFVGNCVMGLFGLASGTSVTGISDTGQSRIVDNKVTDLIGATTGTVAGIILSTGSFAEHNDVSGISGSTNNNFAIRVTGNDAVAISNRAIAPNGSVSFAAATSGGYAAANVVRPATSDAGTNTEAGTSPAVNVVY